MILGLVGLWMVVLIVLTLLHGKAVSDLISGKSLRQENERLKKYNAKVVELEKELQEYRKFTQRVAELAGVEYPFMLSPQKTETNLAFSQKEASPLNEGETDLYSSNTEIASKLSERVHPQGEENATIEPESLRHIPKGQPIDGWITRGFSLKEHVFFVIYGLHYDKPHVLKLLYHL